ncbi:pyrroloquinoline quinone biosynthesis peptide chaperone PqqD [Sulfitobacter sp. D35]|uniref:pyrroloquinoline quinone biosynthesis peptide chaperone PqqD n=1 Tax=Sulfitobacter sp. D35 TaxID=3083252 RepID=UPI00296F700E|nr:pyrroloquinoline quinone biosynthesis peptide chaperone PqqD [Sulfitobacter sp. D35]MDW4498652.1 pyrroloquinoline quinone biosynthesis peptide chaperone PqqD [Sulfitobacter sp. D35]
MSAVAPEEVPVIPRGVRLHHDRVRDQWVLLAPERAVALDPVGHAILAEIDGSRSFGAITESLAAKYDAPVDQIAADAGGFLRSLMDRRILEVA